MRSLAARLRPLLIRLRGITVRVVFCLALQACLTCLTHAQQRNVDPRILFDQRRPLSYAELRMEHWGRGPVDRAMEPVSRSLIELEDIGGPAFIAYYTQMAQVGSQGGSDNWTINNELDTYADWKLVDSPTLGTGSVYVYFYHLQDDFTGTDSVMFADAMGSIWLSNYGDADGVFNALDVLVWEQNWNDGAFEFLVGQIDPGVFFDLNKYAGDDTGFFSASRWRPIPGGLFRWPGWA